MTLGSGRIGIGWPIPLIMFDSDLAIRATTSSQEYARGMRKPSQELPEEEESLRAIGNEWWVYGEDDWKAGDRLWFNLGLRYSGWENNNKFFHVLEPRLRANFLLNSRWILKSGFSVNSQFVHLLSTSNIGLPTDIWVPTTDRTGYQKSWQISLGSQYKLWEGIQLEVEGYYKNMSRLLTLVEGLEASADWEADITQGNGRAWGAEFLLRLNRSRVNGWLGYSLAWTDRKFEDVNFGRRFPFRYEQEAQGQPCPVLPYQNLA